MVFNEVRGGEELEQVPEGGANVAGSRGVDEAGLGVGAKALGPGVQPSGGRGVEGGHVAGLVHIQQGAGELLLA